MRMRTCKILLLAVAIMCLMVQAQGAFARDYFGAWNGHWQRGGPGTTYQAWEFGSQPGPQPTSWYNPNGTSQLTVGGGHYPDTVVGPGGTDTNTWHIDQDGGWVDIFVPNYDVTNPVKYIYLQVTSDKYTLNNQDPIVGPAPTRISTPGPIIQYPFGTWYTYNWLIEIRPNPSFERITLVFPESTNIEEIVVDTICTVPEPSGLLALAGGLAPLGFVIRRKFNK